jgi:hypothetical protein
MNRRDGLRPNAAIFRSPATLEVLAEAHRARLLDFEVALAQLRRTNFYLSDNLIATVRRQVSSGEGKSSEGK